ncbi:ABC transporter substrate-binding protein [Cohnella sp. CFH 77786]|uniref:ABC transporter substrate-binding protein n=1 Tax=Cohnella sp. CFH 77786 TaxID=2662265 RepID=UPI001C6100EA|nr:ABC transporter substrate-binding protein [Cohnella sp. CFH 77786]MBW5448021.1 ABC transporter substrate-binding protein [Cohnella sp. CFH 77786]
MKRFGIWVLILVLTAVLSACGGKDGAGSAVSQSPAAATESAPASGSPSGEASPSSAVKRTAYPLTVKDASGAEFKFEKAPERIVSTSSSETEILFALGLGDRIVGVSDYDNYPEAAKSKPKMGGVTEPNAEAILAAQADLVVSGISIKETALEGLRKLGLNVFRTNPKKVDDVLNNILLFGQINDKQAEAEALVAKMKDDIRKVTEAAATVKPEDKKKVYIEFSPGWTVGKGEFMDELITLAGGVNIASDMEGWNAINEEKVIADNPDVIFYTLNITDQASGKKLEDLIRSRAGWDKIKAIADNRMVGLDGDILSRPGPRITEALLQISNGIYPGLVKR